MPRMKKKVDTSVSEPPPSDLSQTLTAGRSRRTIKPNPKYLNDEMVVSASRGTGDSLDGSGMSEDDFDMEDDELEHLIVRKPIAPSAPQTGSVPKRRGRPPKNPEAPRTEPVKNLRKEVLKKMDYKTLSISKSRLMGLPMLRDGRRKLEMSIDSVESDSADQDDMEEGMEEKLDPSSDELDDMNQAQRGRNPAAYKKHLAEKTILERRGSGSVGSKVTAGTTEDDDDDFYNDSDPKTHQAEQVVPAKRPVGRPRKNFPKQQISPFVRKVLLPGMKNAVGGQPLKRKAEATESDEDGKQRETQQSKMLRRSYGLKHVNSQHQSQDTDSDDDDDDDDDDNEDADESDGGRRKALQRARSFPTLSRGRGRRGSKNSYYMMQKYRQKQQQENAARLSRSGDKSLKPPTITYVNVKDIMKKSKSATDIRRKMDQEDDTDDDASEMEELNTSSKDDGAQSKTNNQLVATILERKRPITIENLQDLRRREGLERKKKELNNRQSVGKQQRVLDLDASETLTADDIVDFEDMLQKNIVSANKSSRIGAVAPTMRGRGRPSENSRPNANASSKSGPYKATRGRGVGSKRSMQPPRILNATMKLGEGRPLSKLSATSGNNHYSIDLADPDNNVKLVSSAENSPVKRTQVSSGGGFSPAGTGTGNVLRAAGNVRPGVVRDNQRAMVEFKKKKVTCYERWHVINCKFSDSATKKQSFALSMIGLGNIAATIQMPSEAWSLRTVLEKRKKLPAEGDEVFTGETQDDAIAEEDKANYEPNRIMFRRKAPTPGRYNVQYDRTVIFRNDCYTINIDGQGCRLVAAPLGLESVEEIEQLLSIVDYIDLKNGCVEVISPVRSATDAAFKRVLMGSTAVAV